jgi:uncharacterized protein (DUF39 family)
MMAFVSVSDAELKAPVVDYSAYYPRGEGEPVLAEVTYAELRSGAIQVKGKTVPTGCFSSYALARRVAGHLKDRIRNGAFLLTEAVQPLPGPAPGGGEAQ